MKIFHNDHNQTTSDYAQWLRSVSMIKWLWKFFTVITIRPHLIMLSDYDQWTWSSDYEIFSEWSQSDHIWLCSVTTISEHDQVIVQVFQSDYTQITSDYVQWLRSVNMVKWLCKFFEVITIRSHLIMFSDHDQWPWSVIVQVFRSDHNQTSSDYAQWPRSVSMFKWLWKIFRVITIRSHLIMFSDHDQWTWSSDCEIFFGVIIIRPHLIMLSDCDQWLWSVIVHFFRSDHDNDRDHKLWSWKITCDDASDCNHYHDRATWSRSLPVREPCLIFGNLFMDYKFAYFLTVNFFEYFLIVFLIRIFFNRYFMSNPWLIFDTFLIDYKYF